MAPSPTSASPTSAAPTIGARAIAAVRRFGPWAVALLSLAWLAHEVPLHALRAAFGAVPVVPYVVVSTVLLALDLLLEAWALQRTFVALGGEVRYGEMLAVRAASYLVGTIQYYLGQAALLGYLHRRARMPYARAGVALLFVSLVNFLWLVILAAVGLATAGSPPPWFRAAALATTVCLVGTALVVARPPSRLVRTPLGPLLALGLPGLLRLVAVWLPYMAVSIVLYVVTLRWFGIPVPTLHAFVLIPVVLVASALPLSVQGIGLTQIVSLRLFAPWAPHGEAAVLAASLVLTSVTLLVQAGMGVVALPRARRLGIAGGEVPVGVPVEESPQND